MESAPPGKDIAAEFKIPASTLSTILKHKERVMCEKEAQQDATQMDVDATLFQWFTAARVCTNQWRGLENSGRGVQSHMYVQVAENAA